MPTPKLSDEKMLAAAEAYLNVGTIAGAARSLGLARETYRHHLRKAEAEGFLLSSGAKAALERTGLAPTEAVLGWRREQGEDGSFNSVMWRTPKVEDDPQKVAEAIREIFEDLPTAPPIIRPENTAKGRFKVLPHSDVHMGAVVGPERAGRDYNPDIAVERLKDGFAECSGAFPPAEEAIILNNGDMTHANDDKDATPKSGHHLKVEGSHRSNLWLSVSTTVWQIDHALQTSGVVRYRANKGNHDPNTPDAMTIALKFWYRDEPRVIIEDDERATWCYQRGKVFLSAHHGDGIKPKDFAQNLPGKFSEEFGRSKFWYLLTGDKHHEKADTFGPIRWIQLPSVCGLDQYADDMGYGDGAAMRAMLFDDEAGLKNDVTVRF